MLYGAWKRRLPWNVSHFVLFRLIKKRSFNFLCVLDLFFRKLAVNGVSDLFLEDIGKSALISIIKLIENFECVICLEVTLYIWLNVKIQGLTCFAECCPGMQIGREIRFDKQRVKLRVTHCSSTHPEGRPAMSDVSPLSGISGLPFDSTLLSFLLFFCLVPLLCLVLFLPTGPFSRLLFKKPLQYIYIF